MPMLSTIAYAFGTLTSDGTIPTANDTVTIGGRVYTFTATVGATAGEVLLGANAAAALANLKAAINGDAGSGTLYGSSTTPNVLVRGTTLTSTTLKLVAWVPGTVGNQITTTEAGTHTSMGGATLASGSGNLQTALAEIKAQCQVNGDIFAGISQIDGTT